MGKSTIIKAVTALTIFATFTSGCGAANQGNNVAQTGNQPSPQQGTAKGFKVGLITDTGGLNDHSFNHLAYVGLQRAQSQLGITGSVVQSKSEADYIPNLTNFARNGYNLVIAVGFLMEKQVEQVSKAYPNTKFLILDDAITDRKNVTGAIFKTEQSAYLAGALAGLLEKLKGLPRMNTQNMVGVVGGMNIPPVAEYIAGFQQGFRKTDPTGTLLVKWVGNFSDQPLGSQIAQSEITSGADIVFQLAGGAGVGVINAAKNATVYAIGADADQSYLAKDTILTSTLKGVDTATFDVIQQTKNGQFKSGVQYFDLNNDGVGLVNPNPVVPTSVINTVNQLKSQIMSGKIKVSPVMQK